MNYGQLITHDTANGPGFRVSLFVSGCEHHCKGCFNSQTWDKNFGQLFDIDAEKFLLEELSHEYYTGLTILGGEPMTDYNAPEVLRLCRVVKNQLPNKTIWIYSGYMYEDLMRNKTTRQILELCNVLVDGPFILEKRNLMLNFRGSENQRIIDLKKSNMKTIEIMDFDRHYITEGEVKGS